MIEIAELYLRDRIPLEMSRSCVALQQLAAVGTWDLEYLLGTWHVPQGPYLQPKVPSKTPLSPPALCCSGLSSTLRSTQGFCFHSLRTFSSFDNTTKYCVREKLADISHTHSLADPTVGLQTRISQIQKYNRKEKRCAGCDFSSRTSCLRRSRIGLPCLGLFLFSTYLSSTTTSSTAVACWYLFVFYQLFVLVYCVLYPQRSFRLLVTSGPSSFF